MQNKKAIINLTWIIIIAVIAILLLFILFSKGAFASKQMTSTTEVLEGCKPKNIPVSIKGSAFTKDTAFFGVIAEPEKITIEQVTAGGTALRALTSQEFKWTVKLYDSFTGNLVTQDGGSNTHPGGSVVTEDKFTLNFFLPDNDCNDRIDGFEGQLVYEVVTDDNEAKAIDQKISFANGRLVR